MPSHAYKDARIKKRAAAFAAAVASHTNTQTAVLALGQGENLSHRHHDGERPHLNEQQLAERWGISVKKLQADRLKGGSIPFVRLGRAVRYRYADVVAWEERHLHTSTTTIPVGDDDSGGVSREHTAHTRRRRSSRKG
jgi:hypothetical protein